MRRSIAALVLALAALGVSAHPAAAASRFVAPNGSDIGNDCLDQYARCATIQHAIDEAGNGDTVDAAAGTYTEALTIDKPLTLRGANGQTDPVIYSRGPETVVDGGTGTAITVEANRVSIEGLTASASAPGTAILTAGANTDHLSVEEDIIRGPTGVSLGAGGEGISVGYNLIEGGGYGVSFSGTVYSNLSIKWNLVTAPVGHYAVLGEEGSTVEAFRLEGNKLPAPSRIAAQIKNGQYEESEIDENSFESTSGPQLAIGGDDVRLMRNTFKGHGTTACLQILGSEGGLVPAVGDFVSSNEFVDCDPYGVQVGPEADGIDIRFNEFPGSYDGVVISNGTQWDVTGRVNVENNRIVGTTHLGVSNSAAGTLNANWNWWGCNAGPGAQGCDGASGSVDASPTVTLGALIGPREPETGIIKLPTGNSITLNPGEEAELAAVLVANGSLGGVPTEGVRVGFSSPFGTLSPTTSAFQNGWTRSIFTAGSTSGQGSIVVSLDNQRTLVPVTICCNPLETQQPPPATQTPPAPNRVVPGKHLLVASHRMTIGLVTCATACQVAPGRGQVEIGGRRYWAKVTPRGALGAEATAPIRVALPTGALRALKKVGKGSFKVVISVTDFAGQISRRAISVKIRA